MVTTHKNLLDEHIRQQGESIKALLRATLNEETAQRHREDDRILQVVNKRVEGLEKVLESRLPQEHEQLVMLIDKNRLEFLNARDDHEK